MQKLTIHQKMILAQKELKPLTMSGKNSHHKYNYTTSSDVLEPVRQICNEYGLILQGTVIDQTITDGKASVIVELNLIDSESGEKYSTVAPGYGEDFSYKDNRATGDKAVYKAITGAMKYAVRIMFCLPSEDDPEKTNKRQQKQLPFSSESEAVNWAMRELDWQKEQAEKALAETIPDSRGNKSVPYYNHIKGLIREKKVNEMSNALTSQVDTYTVEKK